MCIKDNFGNIHKLLNPYVTNIEFEGLDLTETESFVIVEKKYQSASELRKQWMTLMGLSVEEIEKACSEPNLSIKEELEQLEAIMEVLNINDRIE